MQYVETIHEKFLKTRFSLGKDPCAIASARLYLVCRSTETPITLKTISLVGKIERKDIARCFRLLLRNSNEIGFVPPPQVNNKNKT